jgi:very-short-patch-repair endonuclease
MSKMSKGCDQLLALVKEVFPNQIIVQEYNIAEHGSLFLDIYLPHLLIAFEYDGSQHFTYSQHFHGSRHAFLASKKRDAEKSAICARMGIKLIRIRFDEEMNKALLLSKLNVALQKDKDD